MPVTLAVRDETTTGDVLGELELQLEAETVTVGELIRARVHQEVRTHNAEPRPGRFFGLVQPTDEEERLNGSPEARRRRVDPERQASVALDAFGRGHVLVLVDDAQVTELDQQVTLRPGSTVTFLKLMPLVGG